MLMWVFFTDISYAVLTFLVLLLNEVYSVGWSGSHHVLETNIRCNNRQRFPAVRCSTKLQGRVGVANA